MNQEISRFQNALQGDLNCIKNATRVIDVFSSNMHYVNEHLAKKFTTMVERAASAGDVIEYLKRRLSSEAIYAKMVYQHQSVAWDCLLDRTERQAPREDLCIAFSTAESIITLNKNAHNCSMMLLKLLRTNPSFASDPLYIYLSNMVAYVSEHLQAFTWQNFNIHLRRIQVCTKPETNSWRFYHYYVVNLIPGLILERPLDYGQDPIYIAED